MKTDPFRNLYDRAWKAGNDAARASTPEPMVVQQLENPFDPSSKVLYREVVSDGVCGFAWIQFKGNTAFAKWAAKQPDICVGGGYPTGKCISISHYNQSMQLKETHAYAMAKVLNEGGVNVMVRSRMD